VLVRERRTIWDRSIANRVLFAITTGLILWPWISSVALAGLSFVLPPEVVERYWAIPSWTVLQIPMGVTALMLAHYYQRTNTAPGYAGTS
jgi:hypothetical protein